jgi:hypothetical protein
MGQLRDLQEELKTLIPIGASGTTSKFWGNDLPVRLQVYRNTVHGNCYDTIDADFPLTHDQFCEHDWFDLSRAYFAEHPPRRWELNNCVFGFPKFLKTREIEPCIAELALYELLNLKTFVHSSQVKKGSGLTNPTVAIQVFQYQMYDWVAKQCPSKRLPPKQPEVLVFFRDMEHDCYVRKADPLMLLLLDHFRRPRARLNDLEPARAELLPGNTVPLARVLDDLVANDLILLNRGS